MGPALLANEFMQPYRNVCSWAGPAALHLLVCGAVAWAVARSRAERGVGVTERERGERDREDRGEGGRGMRRERQRGERVGREGG